MATPKSTREAPTRLFENYVASIKKDQAKNSPPAVPDSFFKDYLIDVTDFTVFTGNESQVDVPLGFDFVINGVSFDKFNVTPYGWILLTAKGDTFAGGSSTWWEAYNSFLEPGADSWRANKIKVKFSDWEITGIMLAPFMCSQELIPANLDILETSGYWPTTLTSQEKENYSQGKSSLIWPADPLDRGVRYCHTYDKNFGRCCTIRWSTFITASKRKYKFDVAVFENGRIEFRYWPLKEFQPPDSSGLPTTLPSATGIFWSFPDKELGLQRSFGLRDFTPFCDYQTTQRRLSEMGGYHPYEPNTQTWLDPIWNTPYGVIASYGSRIMSFTSPSQVITFSPPVNLNNSTRKSIQTLKNNRQIVSAGKIFDDRKTVTFETNEKMNLYMPSTLPSRLLGNTGDVDVAYRQHLYTTRDEKLSYALKNNQTLTQENNLAVLGSTRKAAVDTILSSIDAEHLERDHVDMSFNEASHIYDTIDPPNEFYASGSSFAQFGDGFTTPLKSKTKFHLTLPITKPTTMPALTSSIYYYDSDEQAWRMVDPDGNKNAKPVYYDPAVRGSDSLFYSKVTETNRGFDAVGRKVNLSSKVEPTIGPSSPTFQYGNNIGAIYNVNDELNSLGASPQSGSNPRVDEALAIKYKGSIWEDPDCFPEKSQQLSLSVDYPFLIEKVVVKFPFGAGPEWFKHFTRAHKGAAPGKTTFVTEILGPAGPIDFTGPGVTFFMSCARKNGDLTKIDLIASGTVTHTNDNIRVILQREKITSDDINVPPTAAAIPNVYYLENVGFEQFGTPSVVLEPQVGIDPVTGNPYNYYDDYVKMDLLPSVAAGVTLAFEHRSYAQDKDQFDYINSLPLPVQETIFALHRYKCVNLLTNEYEFGFNASNFAGFNSGLSAILEAINAIKYNNWADQNLVPYATVFSGPRVYIQSISSLSRGSTGIDFNGNSILGGNVARVTEKRINNPFYVSSSGSLPTYYKDEIDTGQFEFCAVSSWSNYTSTVSPYLLLPGDKLTIGLSKTRPPVKGYFELDTDNVLTELLMSGSHDVYLPTGSIEITLYGSYVREGEEYNP